MVFDVVLNWVRVILQSFHNGARLYPLLVLIAIPIAISILFVAIKIIRKISWGD